MRRGNHHPENASNGWKEGGGAKPPRRQPYNGRSAPRRLPEPVRTGLSASLHPHQRATDSPSPRAQTSTASKSVLNSPILCPGCLSGTTMAKNPLWVQGTGGTLTPTPTSRENDGPQEPAPSPRRGQMVNSYLARPPQRTSTSAQGAGGDNGSDRQPRKLQTGVIRPALTPHPGSHPSSSRWRGDGGKAPTCGFAFRQPTHSSQRDGAHLCSLRCTNRQMRSM